MVGQVPGSTQNPLLPLNAEIPDLCLPTATADSALKQLGMKIHNFLTSKHIFQNILSQVHE